ncbi:hypothetical protein C8J56DRAFT_786902 [Mycena floridula]|nr:hypothetical protein C8J56DRAFT_786902 [Mycena floridula]
MLHSNTRKNPFNQIDTVKISYLLSGLLFQAHRLFSKPCGNNECVCLYGGRNCLVQNQITNYVPTCEGNSYQFDSFDSVAAQGNDFLQTDCLLYSDVNCQNQVADTGNRVSLAPTPGARSMRCFYNC